MCVNSIQLPTHQRKQRTRTLNFSPQNAPTFNRLRIAPHSKMCCDLTIGILSVGDIFDLIPQAAHATLNA